MGVIGGESRHYTGGGLGHAVWKCPACGTEQGGAVEDGCPSCGAGRAKPFKAIEVEQIERTPREPIRPGVGEPSLLELALAWAATTPPDTPLHVAFMAGYLHAQKAARAQTMTAPPVTADLRALAPEGKVARTIIAALELFRDQVLRDASDEIASGEWCSLAEVDSVIAELKEKIS
jgi:hypothetical protein